MSTPRVHTFRTAEPIEVDVDNPAGHVRVDATGDGETRVELTPLRADGATREAVDQARVEFVDGRLVIDIEHGRRSRQIGVSVTVPGGSSLRTRTASADVTVCGRIDSLEASTASGDVTTDDVDGEARVRTASGDVTLGAVTGDVQARTASGDLRLGSAGSLRAESASGDVTVHELGGSLGVKTASGDLRVGRASQGELAVLTASGDVTIGLAEGALAHLQINTLSGSVRNELPVQDAAPETGEVVRINARTLSGDIRICRAQVSPRG